MIANVYTTVNTFFLDMYIHPRIIQAMPNVIIRVTEEEHQAFHSLAKSEGKTLTAIIKTYLLRLIAKHAK